MTLQILYGASLNWLTHHSTAGILLRLAAVFAVSIVLVCLFEQWRWH